MTWHAGRKKDRTDLFRVSAAQRRVSAGIIEKDFWVCWTLKRLFTLPDPPAGLIFKGGTSLSKAYGAIERFSEDVDLSFQRADLGFGGQNDPAAASSRKQREQRLDDLAAACKAMVHDQLRPRLEASFAAALQAAPAPDTWQLALDTDDLDGQTLVLPLSGCEYTGSPRPSPPTSVPRCGLRPEPAAITGRPRIRKSSLTPRETHPQFFREPSCRVHVLAAPRTFCEKLTVLHACHYAPATRPLRVRQSRHYYDVARLYEAGIGKAALREPELLRLVAAHQTAFFRTGWAKYEEAVPGTLRLVPSEGRREELERVLTR